MKNSGTRSPKAVIYVRVSTEQQTVVNQLPELMQLARARGFEDIEVVEDVMSAVKRRPGFERVMQLAHAGKCRTLIVWALDRLGRSMAGNLQTVLELDRLGVEVISARESWLTMQGPVRSLLVAVFGWVSEQERLRIAERTKLGVERARREGKRFGRPAVHVDLDKALLLRRRGLSIRCTAKRLGVSVSVLHRALQAHETKSGKVGLVPKV
jgi:DNA invertase Pin-like site-specific DNA recombinase